MITRVTFAQAFATLALSSLITLGGASNLSAEAPATAAEDTATPAGEPAGDAAESAGEDEHDHSADAPSVADAEFEAAAKAAKAAASSGPKDIPVAGQAVMHLPAGYQFVPQPEAGKLSHALGNSNPTNLMGLVLPDGDGGWIAYLEYMSDGYVKDDDAKNWNADELLQSLKDGTESANTDRVARGFPALEVGGWVETPSYDATAHRLVWAALGRPKGTTGNEGSVNYNTYALGRDGHFELNLISSQDAIDANKTHAKALLAALEFDNGKRYQDFNASTDKVAAYGLAALIGGVAAKKLGLLAVMFGFAAKFAKIIAIAAVAGVAGLKRLFGAKSDKA